MMKRQDSSHSGFTLLELLTVIMILGILAMLIVGSFIGAIKKGRDSRRKQDLDSVAKALELYYEDAIAYPTVNPAATGGLPWKSPTPILWGEKIYLKILPADPLGSGYNYVYQTVAGAGGTPQGFKLYSCLENTDDLSYNTITPTQTPNCGTGCSSKCNYGVGSPNEKP